MATATFRPGFLLFIILAAILAPVAGMLSPAPVSAANSTAPVSSSQPLLEVMEKELGRAKTALDNLASAPYFLSFSVSDNKLVTVAANQGALLNSTVLHVRY